MCYIHNIIYNANHIIYLICIHTYYSSYIAVVNFVNEWRHFIPIGKSTFLLIAEKYPQLVPFWVCFFFVFRDSVSLCKA